MYSLNKYQHIKKSQKYLGAKSYFLAYAGVVKVIRINYFLSYIFLPIILFFSFVTISQAATFSLSGTLYINEGVTAASSGKTINVAVGTSTPGVFSTTTSSDGEWSFSDIDDAGISTTTPFTIWLDGDSSDATTLVSGYSSTSINAIPLYYNYVIAYATSSVAILNLSDFSFYDGNDDADILYINTGTDLIVPVGLLVKQGTFNASTISAATTTNFTIDINATVIAPTNLIVTGNFTNNGTFDNNGGNLYINNTEDGVMRYLSGRDVSGGATGSGDGDNTVGIFSTAAVGNYLYVGKRGNATACSQVVGSADGCELQVYDITDPSDPIYVAGRDASGDSSGTQTGSFDALYISGNYLYVGNDGTSVACSQTAGSAVGCELQVYDISSSTNPIYVAGRDGNGSASGATNYNGINSIVIVGDYLYAGKEGNSTACSQTAGGGRGCELQVYDISSSTNPIYVGGVSSGGSILENTYVTIAGNFLYLGKGADSTACSQIAGSAVGCELQVYDISSSTNPIYVAGRDASGDSSGTAAGTVESIKVSGTYLYVGVHGNETACSQIAGSAVGCELQVYDISSSTNPIYVAGRDASGDSSGVIWGTPTSITISGRYLYMGKEANYDNCSQIAGSAVGCELQVYDISSSTNPYYFAGFDVSGSSNGGGGHNIKSLITYNGYLYLGKYDDWSGYTCSQTAGFADGCELMVFKETSNVGLISGTLTGASALGNVSASGTVNFLSNAATTTDLTIINGITNLPELLTVIGDYQNNSTVVFGSEIYFDSNSSQALGGLLTGALALPSTTLLGSGTKTFTANASTTNLTVIGGALLTNYPLSVLGNFYNNGIVTVEDLFVEKDVDNVGTLDVGNNLDVNGDYTNIGNFTQDNGVFEIGAYSAKYLFSRDASIVSNGTSSESIRAIVTNSNYMYVGKYIEGTIPCSQIAGSAEGCELQVYDISSSTNPIYVAGRDLDGGPSGSNSGEIAAFSINGDFLYVGQSSDAGDSPCSQTAGSAEGCELVVYDISSSTNPILVAGVDIRGSSSGANTGYGIFRSFAISGNSLYAGKDDWYGNPCSQTAGSAEGCELQVYDISSSTNPIYVAGRDADGSPSGVVSFQSDFNNLTVSGDYLYVGKSYHGGGTCSEVPGSAEGCEIMVFDISSTTNPVYIAGRDISGASTDVYASWVTSIDVIGDYLFVGNSFDTYGEVCSQTPGIGIGCELMVYDVSSPSDPIYVAGRDASGDDSSLENYWISEVLVNGDYIYIIRDNGELIVFDVSSSSNPSYVSTNFTLDMGTVHTVSDFYNATGYYLYIGKGDNNPGSPCLQVVASTEGCELLSYRLNSVLTGNMIDSDSFDDLSINGAGATFNNNASTANLTINSGATLIAPDELSISGDFKNQGMFNANSGEVILTGTNQVVTGTTTFYNLTKNATDAAVTTFEAGAQYSVEGEWAFSGPATSTRHSLRSSIDGEYWYINPQGTTTLANLNVKDSYNTNVSIVMCDDGCFNATNNISWDFGNNSSLTSFSNHHFYLGQSTSTLGTIFFSDDTNNPTTASTTDIRITIATSTTNFRFDTQITSLTFGGTASSKVSDTVSYEDEGSTLVIDVITDFDASDTLAINGIAVGSFAAVSTTTSNFALYTSGDISGTSTARDTKTISITGSLLLSDHTLGQVSNQFNYQNKNDEALFAFSLEVNGEDQTIADLVFTLHGVQNLTTSNLTDFRLYKDNNSDRILDGGDTLIDGAGILTINGQNGALTFSSDFIITSRADYIVTGDTTSISSKAAVVLKLMNIGITTTGDVSFVAPYIINTSYSVQHHRHNSSGGGNSARVGALAPAGDGDVFGGDDGGGEEIGYVPDGINIVPDTNFFRPTATGDIDNEWTNGGNALMSDGTYATAASANLKQSYNGFNLGIPITNTVQGISVKLDASGTTADGTIDIALSWDGGSSYTTAKATPTFTDTDIVYMVGGATDTWGRIWTAADFSPTNFRLRVTAQPIANTIRLDALEVRVYHQAVGGGVGGGSRI